MSIDKLWALTLDTRFLDFVLTVRPLLLFRQAWVLITYKRIYKQAKACP